MKYLVVISLLLANIFLSGCESNYETGKKAYESKNYKEAVKLFKRSANRKNADAQYSLGKMYAEGLGTEKNYEEAAKWWKLSSKLGNTEAKEALSKLCEENPQICK